ncbi:MAG: hypothetical protein ACKVHE_12545 [Planctomycetales bacterium]|jgi:hypothetical protein
MATWHVLLYSAAAILALRSFVQLVTNYRNEFEHVAVKDHLERMAAELETQQQSDESEEETAPAEPANKPEVAA